MSRVLVAAALCACLLPATAHGATVTEFSSGITAGAQPGEITAGPDGNLWFTESPESGTARIGRITPAGAVHEFPTGIPVSAHLLSITTGPDGNLWFTENNAGKIGRITPAGTVTEFQPAQLTAADAPAGIVTGPDGDLWFNEASGIGRLTPDGATLTEFPAGGSEGITAGPDGALWFTESGLNKIGRMNTVGGLIEDGQAGLAGTNPERITAGPDGNLWFTEDGTSKIASTTTDGVLAGPFSTTTPAAHPSGIAAGADGNLWFTENATAKIGRVTPTGTVTEFNLSAGADPTGIVAGPDGNLWFTEEGTDRIGRISTDVAAPSSGNLLRNPGFESGFHATSATSTAPIEGWVTTPNFTGVPYGTAGGFPSTAVATSIGGGSIFAIGGPFSPASRAIQLVDVSGQAANIDDDRAFVTFSADLGGFTTDTDSATVTATFLSAAGASLGTAQLGPVTPSDRGSATTLLLRSATPDVPAGTRAIQVTAVATRAAAPPYNDGSVDNVSLVMTIAPDGPPFNKTLPTMTGTPTPGSTLTCNPGTWKQADNFMYRFVRSAGGGVFQPINGSATATYVVQSTDLGSRIACQEIATNALGPTVAVSAFKTAAAGPPFLTARPVISGTPVVGQTLTCTPGTWDNFPLSNAYRWLRDGAPIAGANTSDYQVSAADDATHVACEETASNDVGSGVAATSDAVFAVAGPPRLVAPPVLSLSALTPGGRPTDRIATCTPGTWADDPGPSAHTVTIQHAEPGGVAGDVVASGPTYQVKVADLGTVLSCTDAVTNANGTVSKTSDNVLVPLPDSNAAAGIPVVTTAGGAADGGGPLDPINFLATTGGLETALGARQRVQSAFDAFMSSCKPVKASARPQTILSAKARDGALCYVLHHTPPEQIVVGPDGVRIVADPDKCVEGDRDPCALLPIPMPAASATLPAPVDPSVVPLRVLWDFNNDGRLDASCPNTAPVVRSIFDDGYYNVRVVLVMPYSAATGLYPTTVISYNNHAKLSQVPAVQLANPLPGAADINPQVNPVFSSGQVQNLQGFARLKQTTRLTASARQLAEGEKKGNLRPTQPFACRHSLIPPEDPKLPAIAEGYIGKIHVVGNLAPISLRQIPRGTLDVLKNDPDPTLYNLLLAQDQALLAQEDQSKSRVAAPRGLPAGFSSPAAVANLAIQQFQANVPQPTAVSKTFAKALKAANIPTDEAGNLLDQIYEATGPVKINGVEMDPNSAGVLFVPSDVGSTVAGVKNMVIAAAASGVGLGGVPLDGGDPTKQFHKTIDDAVNSAASDLVKDANLDNLKNIDPKDLDLGPFSLGGLAKVTLIGDTAMIDAHAKLPLLGIETDVNVRATPDGKFTLTGVHMHTDNAALGALLLQGVDVDYQPETTGLSIKAKILLPPTNQGIDIRHFELDKHGDFKGLGVDYHAGAGQGILVGTGAYLTRLGFDVSLLNGFDIGADATLSLGPSAGGGCAAVSIDGKLGLHIAPADWNLHAEADASVICIPLAQITFLLRSTGYAQLKAHFGFGPKDIVTVDANINGEILYPNWQIEADGTVDVPTLDFVPVIGPPYKVSGIVSNKGIALCVGDGTIGAGLDFNASLLLGPAAILANLHVLAPCHTSRYQTVFAQRAHVAQAGGEPPIQVAKDEQSLVISVEGLGAAPRVILHGPDGTALDLSGDVPLKRTATAFAARIESEDRDAFVVKKPAAGTWTVEVADGSPTIVRIQRATLLPDPKITARVTGTGVHRVLHWSVARQDGLVVRFVEQDNQGGQNLATVKGAGTGMKRFVTAEARGTSRQIVAEVEQNGLPSKNVVVARFSAPSPRVARPGRVRIRRQGKTAVVTWAPAFYATRYEVRATRTSGIRELLIPAGRRLRVTIKRFSRADAVTVRVRGVSASGRHGPAATARLRTAKPKRRRR